MGGLAQFKRLDDTWACGGYPPTTTNTPFPNAMDWPELAKETVRLLQISPSLETAIDPDSPKATNWPFPKATSAR